MGLSNDKMLPSHAERNSAKALQERAAQQRARLFKELDITLAVLGISRSKELSNALSAALQEYASDEFDEDRLASLSSQRSTPKAAAAAEQQSPFSGSVSQTLQVASTSAKQPPRRSRSSRSLHLADGRVDSMEPPVRSPHRQQHPPSSSAASSAVVASSGPSEQQMEQLHADRQTWHNELRSVLQGSMAVDDLDAAVQQAAAKAEAIRAELTGMLKRRVDGWHTFQELVGAVEGAARQSKETTRDLRLHLELLEAAGRVPELVTLLGSSLQQVLSVSEALVGAGEQLLGREWPLAVREEEAAAAVGSLRRLLAVVRDVAHRCRATSRQFSEHAATFSKHDSKAEAVAQRLCLAVVGATRRLQGGLLVPASISNGPTAVTVAAAKQLALMWRLCGDVVAKASHSFQALAIGVGTALCQLFAEAAAAAVEMQRAILPESDSDEDISRIGYATTTAWGAKPAIAKPTSPPPPGDSDVQAQVWVPGLLLSLLDRAAEAHKHMQQHVGARIKDQEAGRPGVPALSTSEEYAVLDLLDLMQESFFHLTVANTRRTARLCTAPELLTCKSLDLLREQGEAALRFVQEYDSRGLGLSDILSEGPLEQQQGLELFRQLRKSSDNVVNGLLRVKHLLRVKTVDSQQLPPFKQRTARHGHHRGSMSGGNSSTSSSTIGMGNSSSESSMVSGAEAPFGRGGSSYGRSGRGRGNSSRWGHARTTNQLVAQEQQHNLKEPVAVPAAGLHSSGRPAVEDSGVGMQSPRQPQEAETRQPQPPVSPTQPPPKQQQQQAQQPSSWQQQQQQAPQPQQPSSRQRSSSRQQPCSAPTLSTPQAPKAAAPGVSHSSNPSSALTASQLQRAWSSGSHESKFPRSNRGGLPRLQQAAMAERLSADHMAGLGTSSGSHRASAAHSSSSSGGCAAGATHSSSAQSPAAAHSSGGHSPGQAHDRSRQAAGPSHSSSTSHMSGPPHLRHSVGGVPGVPGVDARFGAAVAHYTGAGGRSKTGGTPGGNRASGSMRLNADATSSRGKGRGGRGPHWAAHVGKPPSAPLQSTHGDLGASQPAAAAAAAGPSHHSTPVLPSHAPATASSPVKPVPHATYSVPAPRPTSWAQVLTGQAQQAKGDTAQDAGAFIAALALGARQGSLPLESLASLSMQHDSSDAGEPLPQFPGGHASTSEVFTSGSQAGTTQSSTEPFAESSTSSFVSRGLSSVSGFWDSNDAQPQDPRQRQQQLLQMQKVQAPLLRPYQQQQQHQRQQQWEEQQQQQEHEQRQQQLAQQRHLAVLRSIQQSDDQFWKIRWHTLEPGLVRKLGSGSYGQVYQGVYLNADVAIKILDIDWEDQGAQGTGAAHGNARGSGFNIEVLHGFKREVDFQRKLSHHPNVVRFIGACCEVPEAVMQFEGHEATVLPVLASHVKLAIVLEMCHLGSLFQMLSQARRVQGELRGGADPKQVRQLRPYGLQFYSDWLCRLEVARGAAAGVEFMHQNGVVHRDLTSYNLLLDFGKPWRAKVCDFNLSRMILDGRQLISSGNPNSPGWQAPEMLAGRPYSKEADVFSFGVLLWEIITLKEPWREETEGSHTGAPLYFIINSVTTGARLAFPDPSHLEPPWPEVPELIRLAQDCWHHNPIERPTMAEVGARLRAIIDNMKERRRSSRHLKHGSSSSNQDTTSTRDHTPRPP